jgi:hypothetical protein
MEIDSIADHESMAASEVEDVAALNLLQGQEFFEEVFNNGSGQHCLDFCKGIFKEIQEPLLAAPHASPPRATSSRAGRARKTLVPTRSSMRLAARPSSVPISQRAQHKLMRELDFVNTQAPAPDAALAAYIDMYGDDLLEQAIKAIQVATRVHA